MQPFWLCARIEEKYALRWTFWGNAWFLVGKCDLVIEKKSYPNKLNGMSPTELSPKTAELQDQERKKKKRNIGLYSCPECGKIFSRTDHLARHHLNHKPKELYECDFLLEIVGGGKRKCGKTFVRRDLRDRHMKRHLTSTNGSRVNWSSISSAPSLDTKELPESRYNGTMRSSNSITSIGTPMAAPPSVMSLSSAGDSPLQISNLIHNPTEAQMANRMMARSLPTSIPGRVNQYDGLSYSSQPDQSHLPQSLQPQLSPDKKQDHIGNIMQTQNELISWLFNDSSPTNTTNMISPLDEPMRQETEPDQDVMVLNNIHRTSHFEHASKTHQFNPADFRSYAFGDDIFHNDLNPLDEVILRSYNQGMAFENGDDKLSKIEEGVHARKDDERFTPQNFNIPSTVSLTSPTSTNDSNATPTPINDMISPLNPTTVQKRIHEYGSKFNVVTNRQIYVDKTILHQLFVSLPLLQRSFVELIFNDKILIEDRFSYYLSVYWLVFHPQFNILHKPSFKTSEAEPLLLLSMILVGCNYCTPPDKPDHLSQPRTKSPEYKLALAIANPLRYAIFQHDGFKSPVRVWVLQGLNLLEWSEKNFLSRTMHERAHIHHGTTVQLMRRSPALGGNPAPVNKTVATTSDGEDESDTHIRTGQDKNDMELFDKWIESESMKRVTFMTFYLDIADYVKFRHNPVISFNQLQLLKLPCDDDLWEASDVNGSFYKIMKKQRKLASGKTGKELYPNESFINVLKKLLKPNPSLILRPSSFVKKILFGGLLSIMYQMQQFELENSTSLITLPNTGGFLDWKGFLSKAIDNFNNAVGESCKIVKLNKESEKFLNGGISTCKFPLYHLAHIVGLADLNTYDVSVFCGSPANQNVKTKLKDRLVVERKLSSMWIRDFHKKMTTSDLINLKSIIHCYIFLWETLLDQESGKPKDDLWNPDKDYFDGMFVMSLVMQTLWSYCYLTSGTESTRYSEVEDNIYLLTYEKLVDLSAESGYEYLQRIKQEFLINLRKDNLHHTHGFDNLYKMDSTTLPHDIVTKYCTILSKISNKQNISGLCFLVGTRLYNSQWEVVRENGKLIINCGFRSIGKQEVFCSDVFDVELLD